MMLSVEAVSRALDRASEAGRFDVVVQLVRELEARMGSAVTRTVGGDRPAVGQRATEDSNL